MDLRNYFKQMDLLVNKSFEKLHVLSFTLKTDLFATEHPHFPRTLPSHNHPEFLIPNTVDWFGFFFKESTGGTGKMR